MVKKDIYDQLYNQLFEATKAAICDAQPEAIVKQVDVSKLNSTHMHGITVSPTADSKMAATIYMDTAVEAIKDGLGTIEEAAKKLAETALNANAHQIMVPDINHDNAKSHLYAVICNAKLNEAMLKECPSRQIEDLAIVARYRVSEISSEDHGQASFLVKDMHLATLGMSAEEVIETAISNSLHEEYTVQTMTEALGLPPDAFGMTMEGPEMYVISNADKLQGAIGAFISQDLRQEICDRVGGDAIIIGSSVHELLALKAEGVDPEDIQKMTLEVNDSCVAREEVLATNVYRIDAQTLKLSLATGEVEKENVSLKVVDTQSQSTGQHM